MYCLKCGRKIPDGDLFCHECGKKREPATPQERPSRQPEQPIGTPNGAAPKNRKKRMNRLLIPMLLLILLLGAAVYYAYSAHQQMNVLKTNYRVKEANLAVRENELSGLEEEYDAVAAELEKTGKALSEKEAEIAALKDRLVDQQSAASQTEYDAAAAEKTIETLTGENKTLNEENEALTKENETLQKDLETQSKAAKTLEDELKSVNKKYSVAKEKSDFMDDYVVFVNNNGTNYYHKYDCSNFTKSNFWAYSRKLAENYGYTPCPVCGG